MINMRLRGEKDFYKALIRIERNVEHSTGEFLRITAEWLKNDIRSHWSTRSPSSYGATPAVVSGNLDSSVTVEKQGRSSGGQFASSKSAQSWYVRVDTANGLDPQGRGGYGQVLEFDLNRPFMRPAIERLEAVYEDLAKRYIKT